MQQTIDRVAVVQHKRVVALTTLDNQFNFLSVPPELRRWACLTDSPIGMSLFDLIPQLKASHRQILDALEIPEQSFVYHHARFAQNTHPDHLFNLQFETVANLPDQYLLTIVPLNPHLLGPVTSTENSRNMAALAQHNRELLLLNHASQILTATLDSDEVLERLLQVSVQIINATGSSVWLWENELNEHLVCRAAFHPGTEERLIGMRVASGQGVVGWVAEENEGAIVSETATDGRFYPIIDSSSGFHTTSILAVPIHWHNRVLGVLEVVNKQNGRFQTSDHTYAEMLAASAAIAIHNAHLIQTLQQKMEDLTVQNAELEAFDRTVAHDLQNPLALVVGFADLLQLDNNEISLEEQDRALKLLVQNAHRMSNIIQELLVLSSVRKKDVTLYPLQMEDIVRSAMDRLRFMLQKYNARVILPKSWGCAYGYAPWVEEVWDNYISNALKYGGNPPVIELGSTKLADDRIKFWIRDNGRGISQDQQKLLFTPFTKLSQVRATGHGLGLSIVRRIVEKLGGEVQVESQPGEGSTFSFILAACTGADA